MKLLLRSSASPRVKTVVVGVLIDSGCFLVLNFASPALCSGLILLAASVRAAVGLGGIDCCATGAYWFCFPSPSFVVFKKNKKIKKQKYLWCISCESTFCSANGWFMVAPLALNHEAVGGWSLIDGACEHLMWRFQQSRDCGLRGW